MRNSVTLAAVMAITSAVSPQPTLAQVPDTLAWQRYFPLSPGNEWQYSSRIDVPDRFKSWRVTADTMIESRLYYRIHIDSYDADKAHIHSFDQLIRYDTVNANVVGWDKLPDGTWVDLWTQLVPCRLDAPLGSFSECTGIDTGMGYFVTGTSDTYVVVGTETFRTPLAKQFDSLGGTTLMAADLGMVSRRPEGNDFSYWLEFARINGSEIGTRIIPTSIEHKVPTGSSLSTQAYPSPAIIGTPIRIAIEGGQPGPIEFSVFDLTGRPILSRTDYVLNSIHQEFALPTDQLSPSVYIIRIRSGSQVSTQFLHTIRR